MTEMVDVPVSELENAPLRYAVAVAAGHDPIPFTDEPIPMKQALYHPVDGTIFTDGVCEFEPDRDWSQCGPLIFWCAINLNFDTVGGWFASDPVSEKWWDGSTPQVAACRAIVAAHNGDTARVPRELVDIDDDEAQPITPPEA